MKAIGISFISFIFRKLKTIGVSWLSLLPVYIVFDFIFIYVTSSKRHRSSFYVVLNNQYIEMNVKS